MARRKSAAAEAIQPPAAEEAPPPAAATAASVPEQPPAEQPVRRYRANPFSTKTVNLDGAKVQLQESRPEGQPWQMQIKFGNGGIEDKPSAAVIEFIKSYKVKTASGAEVNLFRWNVEDRAWAMRIDFDAPATARQKAERVFADVVDLVAQERGSGRGR